MRIVMALSFLLGGCVVQPAYQPAYQLGYGSYYYGDQSPVVRVVPTCRMVDPYRQRCW